MIYTEQKRHKEKERDRQRKREKRQKRDSETEGETEAETEAGSTERAGRPQPVMSVWLLIVLSGWLTRVPCAMGPSPSVDNAVSYSSLPRLIKNRQIDDTSMGELCLTLTSPAPLSTFS